MAQDIIRGRQVVELLTNKSGGQLVAGDVVIIDGANAEAVTTTTDAGYTGSSIAVAVETVEADAVGRFCVSGYVPVVNLASAASVKDFLFTHTVAGQATPSATVAAGAFGQALSAGSTPSASIFGTPVIVVDNGPPNLADLGDVDVTGVQDGDVLIYDDASGDWLPGDMTVPWSGVTDRPLVFAPDTHTHVVSDVTDFPAIPANLDDLTDVDAAAPSDGQALIWSDGDGAWIPGDVQAGVGGGSGASIVASRNAVASSVYLSGQVYSSVAESGSAYAWKGCLYTPLSSVTLYGLEYVGVATEGATYKAKVVTLSGGSIASVVAESAPYTRASGDTADQAFWLLFSSPVALEAGTKYGFIIGRTDSTGTFALPMLTVNADVLGPRSAPFGSIDGYDEYIRVAQADPDVGHAVDTGSGSYPFVMGFMYDFGLVTPSQPVTKILTLGRSGELTATAGTVRLYVPWACTITNVRTMVGTAPVGADLIADLNIDGTTAFTTQGNRPTITAGGYTDLDAVPDVTAVSANSYLTLDIDQIGSGTAGSDIIMQVEVTIP